MLLAACATGPHFGREYRKAERLLGRGDIERAARHYGSALEAAEENGNARGRFMALFRLAELVSRSESSISN